MAEVLLDALLDTLKLIPIILVINLLIELIEHIVKGDKVNKILMGRAAPLWAAAAGLLPQCGFGVVAAHLFARRRLTMGTLLAVIIVTSDEAISVLLSQPSAAIKLLPLLGIKFVFAIAVGFAVDAVIIARQKSRSFALPDASVAESGHSEEEESENEKEEETPIGCHHHEIAGGRSDFLHMIKHPILHTLSIALFILAVNLIIGVILYFVGEERLASALESVKFVQPFIAAAIGLIPNCAASVAIAQMYALGHITLGAAVAGLSVSGGLTLAVLLKENKRPKENVFIVGFLYIICSLLGFALSFAQI